MLPLVFLYFCIFVFLYFCISVFLYFWGVLLNGTEGVYSRGNHPFLLYFCLCISLFLYFWVYSRGNFCCFFAFVFFVLLQFCFFVFFIFEASYSRAQKEFVNKRGNHHVLRVFYFCISVFLYFFFWGGLLKSQKHRRGLPERQSAVF